MASIIKVEALTKTCDICRIVDGVEAPATYDARTLTGRWGNLCPSHFSSETTMELGTGFGQMFLLPEDTYPRLADEGNACPYCLAPTRRIVSRRSLDIKHDECCPRVFDVDGE